MPQTLRRALLILGVVAICIASDQSTKRLADQTLKNQEPVTFLGKSVRLLYAENTGAWGSLGEHWPEPLKMAVLVGLPLLVLAAVVFHLLRRREVNTFEIVAYSLILGGGLGNIIDRITTGYVIDFLYVGFGSLATNIFNVADMAVVGGMALLALISLRQRRSGLPAL